MQVGLSLTDGALSTCTSSVVKKHVLYHDTSAAAGITMGEARWAIAKVIVVVTGSDKLGKIK